MHNFAAVVTFSIFIIGIACQGCAPGTAEEINGNWYCSPVKAITYSNFPGSGSYNRVTYMDADTGECSQQKHTYSGSLSPLNEEVSPSLAYMRLVVGGLSEVAKAFAPYSRANLAQTVSGLRSH